MKKLELLNLYVSNLGVLNVKLHNIHWNVIGEQFVPVHEYTEKLYNQLFASFDEVAERVKMLGEFPKASLREYLEVATIEELGNKSYNTKEALELVLNDLKAMQKLALEIRKAADEDGDFTTVALFEGEYAGYEKEIWFISSMMK